MESKFYDETKLWSVRSEEAQSWVGKHAIVTRKDGSKAKGVIKKVYFAANTNESDNVVEHLWVNVFIEESISIPAMESLEVEQ